MGEGALWARGEARARRAGPASEDGSVDETRPAAIWLCDGRGTLVLLTGAGVPWSGAVEVGAAVEALVPGPSRPRMSSTVRAALDGTPGGFEVVHGGVRWVVRVEPSRDGASGTITRAPESDLHREMVERAPLCVHRIGRDGAFASINQAGVEMLGLADASEALGRSYLQGVDEADLPRLRELMDRAFAGHGSHFELRAGGRVFESCFVPLPDADGQVESIFGLSQDVTERKRTEIELGRSEERYRLLVERSPYCIHQIDQRGCLTSMNAAAFAESANNNTSSNSQILNSATNINAPGQRRSILKKTVTESGVNGNLSPRSGNSNANSPSSSVSNMASAADCFFFLQHRNLDRHFLNRARSAFATARWLGARPSWARTTAK